MRIKDINIVNFKGFQNETVVFNGNLTVVIGNNTAGKTTLLKAIQVGLGAYLQSLKQLHRQSFQSPPGYRVFYGRLLLSYLLFF